jgi:hypothetical protein
MLDGSSSEKNPQPRTQPPDPKTRTDQSQITHRRLGSIETVTRDYFRLADNPLRTDEGLRAPYACVFHQMLRSAQPGGHATGTAPGSWSGTPADRGDDSEDQAVRPPDPTDDTDRVPRHPGTHEGTRCWPHHSPNVCVDSWQQAALRAKSRRGLLPRSETTTQSVRRTRPTTRHHQGWQRLSPKSAD